MSTQPDYYATLHVPLDATAREITRAYRALLRTHHPDTRQKVDDGDTTSAADLQELHAIMQAYVVLSDPGKRAAYDRARRSGSIVGRRRNTREGPGAQARSTAWDERRAVTAHLWAHPLGTFVQKPENTKE